MTERNPNPRIRHGEPSKGIEGNSTAMRATIESALAELAEDAERYLNLYRARQALKASPDSDEAINLEAELEVQAHVLGLHGSDAHEMIDQLDEALSEAETEGNPVDAQPSA